MYEIYNKWPQIAKESSNENFQKIDFKSIVHIGFAGMGGSGSVGDVIGAILSKKDIHVTNVKGYLLPKTVDENTLVIATSVSGNSIEVLEILKHVKKMSTKVVGFSSGGKMENLCINNNIYYQKPIHLINIIHWYVSLLTLSVFLSKYYFHF